MTPRGLDERARVTLPTRPVTCTITPRQIERYLRQTGWRLRDGDSTPGPAQDQARVRVVAVVPDARDRSIPLSRVIEQIADYEKRFSGEVLVDVAAGKGLERAVRRRKRWPSWP